MGTVPKRALGKPQSFGSQEIPRIPQETFFWFPFSDPSTPSEEGLERTGFSAEGFPLFIFLSESPLIQGEIYIAESAVSECSRRKLRSQPIVVMQPVQHRNRYKFATGSLRARQCRIRIRYSIQPLMNPALVVPANEPRATHRMPIDTIYSSHPSLLVMDVRTDRTSRHYREAGISAVPRSRCSGSVVSSTRALDDPLHAGV
jgi:hypothetical protein